MRNRLLIKLTAVMMLVLYVVSIGGINIHVCDHTGKVYVTFLAKGNDCQSIHPDSGRCCHAGCCHEHHSGKDGDCCHNHAARLILTGDGDHSTFTHLHVFFTDSFPVFSHEAEVKAPSGIIFHSVLSKVPLPDLIHIICSLRI